LNCSTSNSNPNPTVHQIGGGGGENGGSSSSKNGVGVAPRNGSELLDQLVYLYGEIKEKTAKINKIILKI
jgi:hypothetical protein